MRKILKNNLRGFLIILLIFSVTAGWLFSGYPQIFNFPPKIPVAQAAVVFHAYAVSTQTNGTTGFTITIPATIVANEDLYILVSSRDHTSGTALVTVTDNDTGGNTWTCEGGSTDRKLNVYWKKATAGTASKTITVAGCVGSCTGGMSAFTGGFPGDPTTNFVVEDNILGNETHAGFTPNNANSFIVFGITNPNDDTGYVVTLLNSANLGTLEPEQWAKGSTGGSDTYAIMTGIAQVGAAATTGNFTWAQTDSTTKSVSFAIKPIIAPTVTTQAASSVEATTATGNGTITDTGGATVTAWGVCYKTSTGCTTADSVAAGSGTGGTGAFTASMAGLIAGTTYYIKAYATNSAGTSYGSEVTILTKPAAPTGVAASDGTYTDKVTITWTKSTGATDYHVWRDSTDLGSAGDVATYDDTGAGAPTITAGSAVASDGTNTNYVELSLSGASANNGTTHTYKVVASNATGNSANSATDTGYRSVGSLTYQWQRSAADSDANYSDISGATTASYNDTGAPLDGSGRYYKCVLNATGATQQISSADRGYRSVAVISVTLDQETFAYGKVAANTASSTLTLWGGAGITATNGEILANFDIYGANSTGGGTGWTLAGNTTGNNYIHQFCNDTDNDCTVPPTSYTALTTSPVLLKSNVAIGGTVRFQLRITTPTTPTDLSQQNAVVTIQASAP